MNTSNNIDSQIENTAHEWLIKIMSDTATDADIDAFEVWRDKNPEHGKAYANVSQIWNELGVLARSPQGENLRKSVDDIEEAQGIFFVLANSIKQRFSIPQYALASLAALLMIILFMQETPPQTPEIYQTTTSEVREITLTDGSIITLGALSRVEVNFNNTGRNVSLIQGQAFFDVAKNPNNPFYVKAKDTIVRVLGTKFDIHFGPKDITVGVLEGLVQVTPKQVNKENHETKVLTAGQMISTTSNGFLNDIQLAQVKPGSWREGRLVYKEIEFLKVIADANRYYSRKIILQDDSLEKVHITTSFDVEQIDIFLKSLPEIFNVDVVYLSSGDIIIKPLKKQKAAQNVAFQFH
tara:strand:- start:681 stop:1736 length:1056 start_codon:yes stop_codon:yes gene_type:complete